MVPELKKSLRRALLSYTDSDLRGALQYNIELRDYYLVQMLIETSASNCADKAQYHSDYIEVVEQEIQRRKWGIK